jgi:hypothetical protein
MKTRERRLLEQLIKSWAQDHTNAFTIADFAQTEEAMHSTEGHLTWVVRESHANLDLMSLADRLEVFLEGRRNRKHLDGMACKKCKSFYEFAESNQEDGSMVCYSCRNNPY